MMQRRLLDSLRTVAGVALAALALGACDPCAGTASCGSMDPQLVIDGQIVQALDGHGVDGVKIEVLRKGAAVPLTTVTANGGFWRVDAPASGESETVDVLVYSPVLAHPYTVHDLAVHSVTRHGDAVVLGRWVVNPYLPFYIDFFLRGRNLPILSTPVDFTPTSGPGLYGPAVDSSGVVHTGTESTVGRAQFFALNAFVKDTGDVVGDITVHLPGEPSVRRGVSFRPTYLYRAPSTVARFGAGPSMEYAAQVFDRATGRPLANVPFDVRFRSGVNPVRPFFTDTTDAAGYARIHAAPLAPGSETYEITFHHPYGPETRSETLKSFDDDAGRFLGNWTIGPVLPYYGLLRANGKDLVGVPVRIRRTGGVDISPADTVVQSNIFGGVPFSPIPHGDGTVTLELTFRPPAPLPSFVVSNVVLPVLRQDVPGGQNIWIWEIADRLDGPPGSQVTRLP